MPTVRGRAEITFTDLSDGGTVDLSMGALPFAADKDGKATGGSLVFSASVRIGSTQVDCTVDTERITKPSAGVTVSVTKATGSMTPAITVTVTNALTQTVLNSNSVISIPVQYSYQGEAVTVVKDIAIVLSKTGATGSTSYSYFLTLSSDAVVRNEDGTLSVSSIVARTTRAQTGSPASWSGWYWVHSTTDGSTWTQIAKSTAAEASKTVSLSSLDATVTAIRVSVHTASPTEANAVDSQTIPIIDAGKKGDQGEPAYTVVLTNESHAFAAAADGKAIASSVETTVRAYRGGTQVAATIGTVTGTISGKLTASVKSGTNSTTSATVTVAATNTLDTRQGMLTIPITVDGRTFNKVFSWSLAPQGVKGDQGDPGEDAMSYDIGTSAGDKFRNSTGSSVCTALVYRAGQKLSNSEIAALGTIRWYKEGNTTPIGTGLTLTVTAADVNRKTMFYFQIESDD